jgi:hypothetical protein
MACNAESRFVHLFALDNSQRRGLTMQWNLQLHLIFQQISSTVGHRTHKYEALLHDIQSLSGFQQPYATASSRN